MAWNDPQWDNDRGGGGPPDLDEIWKRFNQRLNSLLGGKGRPSGEGGGGSGGGLPSFRIPGGAGLLVLLAVLIWLASGFYIVDAGERGVVLRFGKYIETTMPGPRWHMPYPIESVQVVNVQQVRTVAIGYHNNAKVMSESLMLTDDLNIVDLQFSVQYIIKNPVKYLFMNRDPDAAVKQAAESAMREVVGKNKMDFVLYEGRDEVGIQAKKLLQQILDSYNTGIEISQLNMQNAQPPEQVQAAFDDAVKASQDEDRLRNLGEAYANDVVPRANGVAARLQQDALAYKQQVVAEAEGRVSRFKQILAQYDLAPRVTRERMYQDAMQRILTSTTKVLVDDKQGSNLIYLPLDKLMQAAGAKIASDDNTASTSSSASTSNSSPASTSGSDSNDQSRNAFRSRDRETRP